MVQVYNLKDHPRFQQSVAPKEDVSPLEAAELTSRTSFTIGRPVTSESDKVGVEMSRTMTGTFGDVIALSSELSAREAFVYLQGRKPAAA